jgi:hypothetical protein
VPVLKSLKIENLDKIKNWIEKGSVIEVDYPDNTEEIINTILAAHKPVEVSQPVPEKEYTAKKFRNLILKKIVAQL